MTPLKFEALYQDEWQELEELLDRVLGRKKVRAATAPVRGERIAALYRRACEHLALARARSYPAYLLDRLERLTADAHQVIYQQREFGVAALWRLVARDFPRAVRADAGYVWIATALLAVPSFVLARARLLPARSDLVGRRCGDSGAVRADVLVGGRVHRAHSRCRRRLDHVRFLHQKQRRRRVPVFCERPCCGLGQRVFSRLQRRVVRRNRGLSARARSWRHLFLVRRHARLVRADGDCFVRRRGPQAGPRAARAGPAHARPEPRRTPPRNAS